MRLTRRRAQGIGATCLATRNRSILPRLQQSSCMIQPHARRPHPMPRRCQCAHTGSDHIRCDSKRKQSHVPDHGRRGYYHVVPVCLGSILQLQCWSFGCFDSMSNDVREGFPTDSDGPVRTRPHSSASNIPTGTITSLSSTHHGADNAWKQKRVRIKQAATECVWILNVSLTWICSQS